MMGLSSSGHSFKISVARSRCMFDMEVMFKCKGDRLAEVYEVMKQTGMSYGDILLYGADQLRKEGGKKAEGAPCTCVIEPFTKE